LPFANQRRIGTRRRATWNHNHLNHSSIIIVIIICKDSHQLPTTIIIGSSDLPCHFLNRSFNTTITTRLQATVSYPKDGLDSQAPNTFLTSIVVE
jgi:hypothetical protein